MDKLFHKTENKPKSNRSSYGVIPLIKHEDESNKYNVILIKSIGSKYWGFPKGKPEKKDVSVTSSAIREFQEELGTDYTPELVLDKSFKNKYEFVSYKGEACTKTVEYWIGFVKGKRIEDFKAQRGEVSEIRITSTDEALELLTFYQTRKLLIDALTFLRTNKQSI